MLKFTLILSAILAVAFAKVRSCDRGVLGPNPTGMTITGCDINGDVCRIVRGKDILGKISFVATSDAVSLEPEITAYAFGIRAVYELPADRQIGCNWIEGTNCPLDRGEFATYNLFMPVIEEYPLTKLDIEVRMYDQNRNIQFCTVIESEVVIG
jgi:ML domain